ncbi:MAG: hypothetical protein HKO57_00955, partial [Akkermansiaceae bacterium]|nr:hypothetical protein [Akkermansiaceae bacterium]
MTSFPGRRLLPLVAVLSCGGGIAFLGAGEAQKGRAGVKLRPTHADLAAKREKTAGNAYKNAGLEPIAPGTVKRRENTKEKSLLLRSTVLSSGTNWTIVPKGAVVHVPPGYKARVGGMRTGKLLDWATFHQRNRGWLYPIDVSIDQARGETAIPEETVDAYQRLGRVVVATCRGGPIS